MLDNLANADLSGIQGDIQYKYNSADAAQAQLTGGLIGIIALIVVIFALSSLFSPSRPKRYRRLMVAMYVAAKVRKLAKDEGLDIENEYKTFQSWEKKNKSLNDEKGLDDVIEDETSEKLIESREKENKK